MLLTSVQIKAADGLYMNERGISERELVLKALTLLTLPMKNMRVYRPVNGFWFCAGEVLTGRTAMRLRFFWDKTAQVFLPALCIMIIFVRQPSVLPMSVMLPAFAMSVLMKQF